MADGPFSGKVALVTGAGSGMGRSAAIELARNEERVQAAVTRSLRPVARPISLLADVARQADLEGAVAMIERTWGRLDSVVVDAGANGVWAPIDDLTLEEWNHTSTTNLTRTFLITRASVPLLRKQGGAIVITAAVNGSRIFSDS